MKNKEKFCGIIPPSVTPLREDGTLDAEAVERLMAHCRRGGISGVFVNGTSGEAMRVPDSVWEENARVTLRVADGGFPVFCGAIDASTDRTIERIRRIEDMGGKIAVCTPPFYLTSFGQEEILRHFDKVCQSSGIDIAVYNIPETTHANILPETIAKLADYENIVAYKDSTADWQQLQRAMILLKDKDIAVFNGAEELCSAAMLFGCDGCIPGLANFVPELFVDLREAALAGDIAKCYALQSRINRVRKAIFVSGCWVSGMKGLLEAFGLGERHVSAPLLALTQAQLQTEKDILAACGVRV